MWDLGFGLVHQKWGRYDSNDMMGSCHDVSTLSGVRLY